MYDYTKRTRGAVGDKIEKNARENENLVLIWKTCNIY
jgi:hypothetical protein